MCVSSMTLNRYARFLFILTVTRTARRDHPEGHVSLLFFVVSQLFWSNIALSRFFFFVFLNCLVGWITVSLLLHTPLEAGCAPPLYYSRLNFILLSFLFICPSFSFPALTKCERGGSVLTSSLSPVASSEEYVASLHHSSGTDLLLDICLNSWTEQTQSRPCLCGLFYASVPGRGCWRMWYTNRNFHWCMSRIWVGIIMRYLKWMGQV